MRAKILTKGFWVIISLMWLLLTPQGHLILQLSCIWLEPEKKRERELAGMAWWLLILGLVSLGQ